MPVVIRETYHNKKPYGQWKNRFIYSMLGLFAGALGVHNFYAGRKVRGILQLLTAIIWLQLLVLGPVIAGKTGISEIFLQNAALAVFGAELLWVYLEVFLLKRDSDGDVMDDQARPARILLAIIVIVAYVILPSILFFYQRHLDQKAEKAAQDDLNRTETVLRSGESI